MKLGFDRYRRYTNRLAQSYEKPDIKAYTGLTLSFFAVAFFGIFAVRPALTTILELVKEIEAKEAVAQRFQEKINHLSLAQENYVAAQEAFPLIDEALPQEPVFADFIRQVEALATRNSLSLSLLQVGEVIIVGGAEEPKKAGTGATLEEQEEGLTSIEFGVTVAGDYENLRAFLNSLENWRRLALPATVTFNVRRQLEEEVLALNISGKIYYYVSEGRP